MIGTSNLRGSHPLSSRNKKLLSYYKPYMGLLSADIVCAIVVSATTLLLPLCIRYITKDVLDGNAPNALVLIFGMGAVMLVVVAINTACNMFVSYQGHMMGALMESDMRTELFGHFQKLSLGFYDDQRTGQMMTRLTNDTFALSELFHHGPEDIAISLLNFIGAFIILVSIDVNLTLVVLLFLPIMAVYAVHFNRVMKIALRRSKDRVGDINAQVEDTLSGARVVKSFTNEALEEEKFGHENDRFVESRREEYKSSAFFFEGLIGFTLLMTVVVVVFGGIGIESGALDLSDLITFLLYIGILIEPIRRFGNFTRLFQEGVTGFDRLMEILEIEPDIQDASGAVELTDVQGSVTFQDVSFRYGEGLGYVLENVSLDIKAGEYVALVGSSGVGKTTLCSLIPRFYEIDAGDILLDGISVKDIRLNSLRRNIGFVHQDVYLFSGTVAENIRYGMLDAPDERVIDAAKKANAHDFIMELPDGYDTDVGQRGVKLSGGQKQRLSIARVILKNPPVVIFDEATSALDNDSELAVQTSLENLADTRTTLVIAHRLSTVRNAQRILVMTGSGIQEEGTHEELITRGGVYADLYKLHLRI